MIPVDKTLELAAPLATEDGGSIPHCRIAYRLHGPIDKPKVLVLGGISADRHVASSPTDANPGWWEMMVGPGRAIDTRSVAVLSVDYLAGSGNSSGPDDSDHDISYPQISTYDQAAAIIAVLDELGVNRLQTAVGASYGGMVILALAERFPDRLDSAIAISAAHRSHPMATALRALQRDIVRLGLESGRSESGMRLARALAMTTYRTAQEFEERFAMMPAGESGTLRFPVEGYLAHAGKRFADRFSPRGFLALSESLDTHRVDPAAIRVPVRLISVDSDLVVPHWQMEALANSLPQCSGLSRVSSLFGHDAFLKEQEIAAIVSEAIGS